MFFSSRLCVRVNPSLLGVVLGLNLGYRFSIIRWAVRAHISGFLHPFSLSSRHSLHRHAAVAWWVSRCVSRSVASFRFLTDLTLCVICRHSFRSLWYVFGGAPRCSQASIWFFSWWDSFRVAKLTLCLRADDNMLVMILGSRFTLFPLEGGSQEVRKAVISLLSLMPLGFSVFMIASAVYAHAGLDLVRSIYSLIHVISIALFLVLMFRRSRPPSLMGCSRRAMPIGEFLRSSHMKVRIVFFNTVSIDLGIPCAFVRNWVIPPTTIWTISLFPSSDGWHRFHRFSVFSILPRTGSQVVTLFISFPIHAPSVLIGFPSLAMRICSVHGLSWALSFLSATTFSR